MMKLNSLFLFMLLILSSCSHFNNEEIDLPIFSWIDETYQLELVFDSLENDDLYQLEIFNKLIRLKDDQGKVIPVARVRSHGKNKITVITGVNLDLSRNYYFQINGDRVYAYPSKEYLNKYYQYQGPLGVNKSADGWTFTLWSPTATDITLRLYRSDDQRRLLAKRPMSILTPGVWQIHLDPRSLSLDSLEGLNYQYEIFALGEKKLAADPYSYSLAAYDVRTKDPLKSSIVDIERIKKKYVLNRPQTNKQILKDKKFVGYETHLRDLTISPSSSAPDELKGTYLAAPSSIEHLKDLGITHIQLMPLAFFASVNERDHSYQSLLSPYDQINYNWGYDTQHFFSLSGYYSSSPHSPSSRIEEFRKMVHSFHKNNIGVIMDVVFNHLYDGLKFENAAPGCYLRRDRDGAISKASGAGFTFDSTIFMGRRMIIDSLDFFHNFYHVNGFRFDLMSFIDRETLILAQKRLGDDVLLYGEGWNSTDLPKSLASTMHQLPTDQFGAFNDQARDSIIGQLGQKGVVLGNSSLIPAVKSVISGSVQNMNKVWAGLSSNRFHHFAKAPQNSYIYLDIHDGPTLWDKVDALSSLSSDERIERIKQAYAVLFTSQGTPILHAGSEMGRTKPTNSQDKEISTIFYGQEFNKRPLQANSYRHGDDTNAIDWKLIKSPKNITSYIRQLIEVRNRYDHFSLKSKEELIKRMHFVGANNDIIELSKGKTFTKFQDLDALTLHFINGPKEKLMYIAGEIHPDYITKDSGKNPKINDFKIQFDSKGNGEITLSKQTLEDCNYDVWSDPDALNIKLINTPGLWDTIPNAYEGMGNNTISITSVSQEMSATIDLSKMNASSDDWKNIKQDAQNYIAYIIKGKNASEKSMLIIHNFSPRSVTIEDNLIKNGEIIFKIKDEPVFINNGKATVSAHQSVIVMI